MKLFFLALNHTYKQTYFKMQQLLLNFLTPFNNLNIYLHLYMKNISYTIFIGLQTLSLHPISLPLHFSFSSPPFATHIHPFPIPLVPFAIYIHPFPPPLSLGFASRGVKCTMKQVILDFSLYYVHVIKVILQ